MVTSTYEVQGMTCGHCVSAVSSEIGALDGVPPGERQLHLSIAADRGQGELAVADSGPGVTPEQLPRLFEPFFTTRSEGLGLGLSLCESLAGAMGGRLVAALHPPRGLVLRLTLPQAAA